MKYILIKQIEENEKREIRRRAFNEALRKLKIFTTNDPFDSDIYDYLTEKYNITRYDKYFKDIENPKIIHYDCEYVLTPINQN